MQKKNHKQRRGEGDVEIALFNAADVALHREFAVRVHQFFHRIARARNAHRGNQAAHYRKRVKEHIRRKVKAFGKPRNVWRGREACGAQVRAERVGARHRVYVHIAEIHHKRERQKEHEREQVVYYNLSEVGLENRPRIAPPALGKFRARIIGYFVSFKGLYSGICHKSFLVKKYR